MIANPRNVELGNNVRIGFGLNVSAVNAKCIVKVDCAIAENLTEHTGPDSDYRTICDRHK